MPQDKHVLKGHTFQPCLFFFYFSNNEFKCFTDSYFCLVTILWILKFFPNSIVSALRATTNIHISFTQNYKKYTYSKGKISKLLPASILFITHNFLKLLKLYFLIPPTLPCKPNLGYHAVKQQLPQK